MLLSEMFGVERDTDFMVKGHSRTFRIRKNSLYGHESIYTKMISGVWVELYDAPTIIGMIADGPDCIIHLPPPLTDEQREQLKAIWTLGGRWLAKDADRDVYAYSVKPERDSDWAEWVPIKYDEDELQFTVYRDLDVCALVSWSDPEPFDIGKALGVEG